jgi:hypothetical protein
MVKQQWQLYVPMHELAFLMEVALLSTTSMASSSCLFVQLLLEHAIDDPIVLFLFLVLLLVQGDRGHSFCQCLFGLVHNSFYEAHWTSCCTDSFRPSFQKLEPTHLGPTKGVPLSFSKSYKKYTKLVRLGIVRVTCSFVTHVESIKWKKSTKSSHSNFGLLLLCRQWVWISSYKRLEHNEIYDDQLVLHCFLLMWLHDWLLNDNIRI